jgi:hypothetical protein
LAVCRWRCRRDQLGDAIIAAWSSRCAAASWICASTRICPPIYRLLRAGSEGQIRIEVLAQLDAQHVRGIA